jgi:uncharacterized protein (DUF433 family)
MKWTSRKSFLLMRGFAEALDGLAEDMTEPEIMDHCAQLTKDDIHACLAYAADLAHESVWKMGTLQ